VEKLIHKIINQMKLNPNSIAIEGDDFHISYDELMNWTYGYANEIVNKKIIDSWIGIDLSLGWKAYPAILACWITGNGYLPINFYFPKIRILEIQNLVKWSLLIDSSTICKKKEKVEVIHGEKAYLLFTSGTTGKPKGVPINQVNLEAFAGHYLNHKVIKFTSKDKFLQSYELTFDVSVFCFLTPFLIGATLVLPCEKKAKQLAIFKAIEDHNVTVTSFVPSIIRLSVDFLPRVKFSKLRYSFFSGESLMGKEAKVWMQSVPNAQVYNCYGPTETVIVCTEELLNNLDESYFSNGSPLPLGEKFEEIEFEIIEQEIVYSGKQTFNGYLNNPFTNKFYSGDLAEFDSNGKLIFLGRKDNQIQWNGYRIELEEVEFKFYEVMQAQSKLIWDEKRNNLVFVSTFDEVKVRNFYEVNFPSYYMPSEFKKIKAMPLNLNSKLDLNQLKKLVF
jgi:acyl-coenzyme A synthetase/AMP-(fatty) acid ligase